MYICTYIHTYMYISTYIHVYTYVCTFYIPLPTNSALDFRCKEFLWPTRPFTPTVLYLAHTLPHTFSPGRICRASCCPCFNLFGKTEVGIYKRIKVRS